jgi:Tfp pilus assembly major pilin PilA
VVVHAFNPSTWEAEAGGFLSSRPAWSTKWVPGQPGLHRETLSWKATTTTTTKKNKTKKGGKITFTTHRFSIEYFLETYQFRLYHWYYSRGSMEGS